MRKVLFISPHLDDAVFSCAVRIAREVEAGAEVIVATVFSHGSRQHRVRRVEDRRALRTLGAKPVWLGLLDAPCRNPFYNSFRRIVFEVAPGDWEHVNGVRTTLERLISDTTPETVYLPLGVGMHIDHRMVFAAGAMLPGAVQRFYYEDQPYALVRYSVSMRLATLRAAPLRSNDISAQKITRRAFLKSFRSAPYVREYLRDRGERRDCESLFSKALSQTSTPKVLLEHDYEIARDADRTQVLEACYAYDSQARLFLGKRGRFVGRCREYADLMAVNSWRVERYWRPLRNRDNRCIALMDCL